MQRASMIFISYRRADTQQAAGRIRERLAERYGAENIFLDIDTIATGQRFLDAITRALARSDVLLMVIGARWTDEQNGPRLFDPADAVRLEIETAKGSGVTIIPVLLDRASVPAVDQVPQSLHSLLGVNAASIESGINFGVGVERLVQRIDAITAAAAERREAVTLRDDAWQLLSQPTKEAIKALARDRTDPSRIYASAVIARRILRGDADGTRWISYATLPAGNCPDCLAVSGSGDRGILWVGTTGHLFQYHQADFQWRDTEYFMSLAGRGVRSIAVDPTDPAHILIGTGQYSSGTTMGVATASASGRQFEALDEAKWKDDLGYGDLHSTRNGGVTWRTGPFRNVNRAVFAETNPRFVYVATADDGLFVSTNGAASFGRSLGTEKETLWSAAVSPHDPSQLVLGTRFKGALLSSDAGQTWSRPAEVGKTSVLSAAFAQDDPAVLILGTDSGVFLSTDHGQSFTLSNSGLVHKRVSAALSLVSDGFMIGTDGGGIYVRKSSKHDWWQTHRGVTHPGIGALVFDADDVMYIGAEGILCRTDDLGLSMQSLYQVLETIRSICVFGSSDGQGGGGQVVRWNRCDTCLIGTEHGDIYRSADFGENWERVLERGGGLIRKIACSATRPGTVYAVAQMHMLYVSEDAGRTWHELTTSQFTTVTFALSNDQPQSVLIGTYQDGVLVSDDGGIRWQAVGSGLPAKPITSLQVSPTSRSWPLMAGLQSGGIWRFSSRENLWIPSHGPIEDESVNDIYVSGEHILVATNTGAFRSTDGGASWASYSDGLTDVRQVNRLALCSDGRTAFCGEVGGLYGRLVT
jgi:photosystem II stability/assembly factor-like uncharacterized protein